MNTQPNTLQPYHPSEPPVQSLATMHEYSVEDVIAQITKIQQVMKLAMREGEHYGIIPGATKPSLLKPGAEKLGMLFRLDPQYEIVEKIPDGQHLTFIIRCTLYHIPTGNRMGSGMGICSTKEKKYAMRTASRKCPRCGMETIFKSKFPPKSRPKAEPGWYCYAKKGGCGFEYAVNDSAIVNQPIGEVPNTDLATIWNTVIKMANKRAHVAAILTVTAASDIFTQDVEDLPGDMLDAKPLAKPGALRDKIIPPTDPTDDTEIVIGDDDEDEPEMDPAMPDPPPAPVAAMGVRLPPAPVSEWLQAFTEATSEKGLHALWKGCTAPEVWKLRSVEEQAELIEAKNEAKARLGVA